MHIFGLSIIDIGKVMMLLWCVLAAIGSTCDRFMIFGVKPPKFWFRSLQALVDAAVADFEKKVAAADIEGKKHHHSDRLHHALLHAHMRFALHGTSLPWFRPRQFARELFAHCDQIAGELDEAMAYQKSPAFLIEASEKLRLAREQHPERLAEHLRQIEGHFQQRLIRLQNDKETSIRDACLRQAAMAEEIETQLGEVEAHLQQLVAGTRLNTTTDTATEN